MPSSAVNFYIDHKTLDSTSMTFSSEAIARAAGQIGTTSRCYSSKVCQILSSNFVYLEFTINLLYRELLCLRTPWIFFIVLLENRFPQERQTCFFKPAFASSHFALLIQSMSSKNSSSKFSSCFLKFLFSSLISGNSIEDIGLSFLTVARRE